MAKGKFNFLENGSNIQNAGITDLPGGDLTRGGKPVNLKSPVAPESQYGAVTPNTNEMSFPNQPVAVDKGKSNLKSSAYNTPSSNM